MAIINGNTSSEYLVGTAADDTIIGGKGNDFLEGGAGSDTYEFAKGDGVDQVYESYIDGIGSHTIYFKDVKSTDIVGLESVGDGTIRVKYTATDAVDLLYFTYGSSYQPTKFKFSDGVEQDSNTFMARFRVDFTDTNEDDYLVGTVGNNQILGSLGNDFVSGLAGTDTLIGGVGNDSLYGGDGHDILEGGIGNDLLYGGSQGVEVAGDDTYIVNKGDGVDTIVDNRGANKIIFNNMLVDDIDAAIVGVDLVIKYEGGQVVLDQYLGSSQQVFSLQFADGSILNNTQLNDLAGMQYWLTNLTSGSQGATNSFKYFFPTTAPSYLSGGDVAQWQAFNSSQKALVLSIFNNITQSVNVSFTEATTAEGVDVLSFQSIQMSYGGYAYYPYGGFIGSDVFINKTISVGQVSNGEQWLYAHEIGHALGLQHSFEGELVDLFSPQEESTTWTNLSYTHLSNDYSDFSLRPFDIATLQAIYGVNPNARAGNDSYLFNASTGVLIWDGAGNDTIDASSATQNVTLNLNDGSWNYIGDKAQYISSANQLAININTLIENAKGGTGNDQLTGNEAANKLEGGAGHDTLNGKNGIDTLIGGTGNDTYIVNSLTDVITELVSEGIDTVSTGVSYTLGVNLESLILTGTSAINGTGNSLANTLTGNSGNNLLDGGSGADTHIGGLGNDTYIVGNVADVIVELANQGIDTVSTATTYTLGANLESLILTGASAVNGTGNELANTLTGNGANNRLNGGTGADKLVGSVGNDTYVIDNIGDVVTESSTLSTEIDTVEASMSYTLGTNLEKLVLTGTAAINGTGNGLANTVTGNSGNNLLDGGSGADTHIGGLGNDTYLVGNVADVIVELANQGIDTVSTVVSHTLAANLENLILTGTSAVNGTGNSLANTLTGNSGNNRLDGGTGADTLIGGLGNDSYVVDNVGDVVTETSILATEIDTVEASISYTLGANLEKLVLTGTAAINGVGNSLANTVTGNSGNNLLDGGSGADTHIGGLGNDTYIVGNVADVIVELANQGIDTVSTATTYTLGANLENLILTGTSAVNGTGNSLANTLTGNSGNNRLDGGTGADTLIGGLGNDSYVFNLGGGVDRLIENDSTAANTDVLSFLGGIAYDQLWFSHVGANLEVSVIGTTDKVIVQDWYVGSLRHVEQLKASSNKTLLDTEVESLVTAMAALTPPPLGQTTLTAQQHSQLDSVLAANWS